MTDEKMLVGPFAQILTMRGLPGGGHIHDAQLEIVEGGAVLLEGGRISRVLDRAELERVEQSPQSAPYTHLRRDMVLLPGLVDCHTHICYAGSRIEEYGRRLAGESYHDIAASGGGIMSTVRSTRAESEADLARSLAKRAEEHLARGVTTCEVKSGYGLEMEAELRMLRAIERVNRMGWIYPDLVPTCLAAHVLPHEFRSEREYLEMVLTSLLPAIRKEGLANRVDAYLDQGAFSVEEGERYLKEAKDMGFDIVVHADQFEVGGSEVAARLRAKSADHLERTGKKELGQLKEAGVAATVLPCSTLGLGLGFAPAHAMLDAGLTVAIASDWNPGTAPMGDLMVGAALLASAEKLTAAETYAGLTCRAASALGLKDRGTIQAGMMADMVAFPCSSYLEPLYRQGALRPCVVIRRGKMIDLQFPGGR